MNRSAALRWAEVIDGFRIFPRAFLIACFLWTLQISYMLLHWYMALSKEDRGIEASGFASVVFLTAFGFMKLVFETYSRNGRDWNATAPATTSTVVASTTTTGSAASGEALKER